MSQLNTVLVVDSPNFIKQMQSDGFYGINYKKLQRMLAGITNASIRKALWFASVYPRQVAKDDRNISSAEVENPTETEITARVQEIYESVGKTDKFLYAVQQSGFQVITRTFKVFSDGKKKGDIDVKLAVETLFLVMQSIFTNHTNRVQQVIFLTGDDDYIDLLRLLHLMDVRVVVAFVKESTSADLMRACDEFVELTPILRSCVMRDMERNRSPARTDTSGLEVSASEQEVAEPLSQ